VNLGTYRTNSPVRPFRFRDAADITRYCRLEV
jgi:hypothetical protein